MINAKATKDGVTLGIEINIPGHKTWTYNFRWTTNDEAYSQLLTNQINEDVKKNLKVIRREAYNEGWKDAKAKRKKESWFGGWW